MQSNEHYLKRYDDNMKSYTEKGEPWRMKISREEFIQELERFRKQEAESMARGYLTPYNIQSNIEGSISILLMPILTMEEAVAQMKRHNEITDAYFAEAAPRIKKEIQMLSLPLDKRKIQKICAALFRKQIEEADIPSDLFEVLKEERMYISINKRMDAVRGFDKE